MDPSGLQSVGSSTTITEMAPIPMTSSSMTSNYVVHVDPSGHFEIVDSSLSTNRTVELTGEGDEAVYKIRDEDFCFRGPLMDQGFAEIDIDPVMDIGDIFQVNRPFQFIQQSQEPQIIHSVQANQFPNLNFPTTLSLPGSGVNINSVNNFVNVGYEEMNFATERDNVQTLQAFEEYGATTCATTMSIPYQINQLNQAPMSNLIPGTLQMDNNLIIYNTPNIVQLPVPVVTSTMQMTPTQVLQNVQNQVQLQLPMQVQIPCTLNPTQTTTFLPTSTTFQQQNLDIKPTELSMEQSAPLTTSVALSSVISSIPYETVDEIDSTTEARVDPVPKCVEMSSPDELQKIQDVPTPSDNLHPANPAPSISSDSIKISPDGPENSPQPPALVCTDQAPSQPESLEESQESKVEDEDLDRDMEEMDIKIVSCVSQQPEFKRTKGDGDKTESTGKVKDKVPDDKSTELKAQTGPEDKVEEKLETKKSTRAHVKKMKEEPKEKEVTERIPRIPDLLFGYVDKDDELLIAFKNRPDRMKTDICIYCYSWFDSPKELQTHLENDHAKKNPKLHKCKICDARFVARIMRLRHQKLHKYDMKYRHNVYLRSVKLRRHLTKRFRPAPFSDWYDSHIKKVCNLVENLPYECFDCGVGFRSYENIDEHYQQHHATQRCGLCGEVSLNSKLLHQHKKDYHGQYNIIGNYTGGAWNLWDHWLCEESVEKDVIGSNVAFFHDYLKRNPDVPPVFEEDFVEQVLNESVADVEEPEIGKEFTPGIKSAVESPTLTIIKEEDQLSICSEDEEDLEFANDRNTTQEYRLSLPFKCKCCPKSYDNEHDLRRHARCHGGEKDSTLACQFCGKLFKTHSHKKEHERTHTGEKPYVCPICNRSFIQSSNLKKHIQTHKTQNTLQCTTCGKQFIKEASLVLHQRAHAQDRKFRCEICDRAYNYASLLKRHMRIHTGEMPYSCESCGMLFHELVSLHYHRKKVHTGERPHRCETCGRAFILSSDLKKHVLIHLKPPAEKSPPKSIRKRSQSKSTDKGLENPPSVDTNDATDYPEDDNDTTDISIISAESQLNSHTDSLNKEEAHTPEESKGTHSNSTPSPSSVEEDDQIITNKRPILRVYSRRDTTPKPAIESPTKVLIATEKSNQMDTNHTQEQPTSTVPNIHEIVLQSQGSQPQNKIEALQNALMEGQGREMLLELNVEGNEFQETQLNMFPSPGEMMDTSSYTVQATTADTLPKNIEDVLQFSGISSFGDFDMNNIIVVAPEAASEVEIVLDDDQMC